MFALNTGPRHDHLPRHLGSVSARCIGFVAFLTPPSRRQGVRRIVQKTRTICGNAGGKHDALFLRRLHLNLGVLDTLSIFANVAGLSVGMFS